MSRVEDSFARAAAEDRAALVGYLTAGYPDDDRFIEAASSVLEHADMLEVGLPFSDPLGDGPTVQRSGEAALARGVDGRRTVELVGRLRAITHKPLLVMSYYNPIYCYPGGETAFVADLAAAGGDGMILPDLPPDEGEELIAAAREADLDTVFLVAPTSTDERLQLVTAA
ncbi:MAG TPA: tryptophan synthase subunit alpha, partial [Trueperaceae bacterium]|nr:tryptophan synthase subunit alpha [Trueperaceae bacterium]